MALIIVESPTKARTFNRLLKGKDYYVFATMGHFRDLPSNRIAIQYDRNFEPEYEISEKKKKTVDTLLELAKNHKEIILATDLDREGESISYHVAYILGFIDETWPDFSFKNAKNLKRIVFHEITEKALHEALDNPGELRVDLVKAQQARRILDRIVGYELSPLLWKKMSKNWLSAGRVQTVCLRLVVEREHEITKFNQEPYYQIYAMFQGVATELKAQLVSYKGIPYEEKKTLSLFDGSYSYTKTSIGESEVNAIQSDLKNDSYSVSTVGEEIKKRYPPPPLTTSLLQQEAYRRFGFSSKLTMRLAQNLYEHGLITYHRTDSFQLSSFFVFRAKDYITEEFGNRYALEKPRGFATKSKLAQEAHEAIRPTKIDPRAAEKSKQKSITSNHKKLYDLIFTRSIATQMKEAEVKVLKVSIKGNKEYVFEADFQQILFDGFLKLLNPDFVKRTSTPLLVKDNESLALLTVDPKLNKTLPPPRYNEASLIKTLEEKGIGRPSTYASIISLIQDKYYVEKESRYFMPTKLGEAIVDYLTKTFSQVFELEFTARMEDDLDRIANGEVPFVKVLSTFYDHFKPELEKGRKDTSVIDVEEKAVGVCEKCGGDLIMRFSKFGKFYGCRNYPTCKFIKPFLYIVKDRYCPLCKGNIISRFSKTHKRFYGCSNYPTCKFSSWKMPSKLDEVEIKKEEVRSKRHTM